MLRDLVGGALGLLLAGAYYMAADALPTSLLSDAVGADGLPKALAVAVALLSALLIVRAAASSAVASRADRTAAWNHLRALGVVGLGAGYAAAAPVLGYPLALAVLIGAAAVYYGLKPNRRLLAVAALGAAGFWALFVVILGIAMPVGLWPRLLG